MRTVQSFKNLLWPYYIVLHKQENVAARTNTVLWVPLLLPLQTSFCQEQFLLPSPFCAVQWMMSKFQGFLHAKEEEGKSTGSPCLHWWQLPGLYLGQSGLQSWLHQGRFPTSQPLGFGSVCCLWTLPLWDTTRHSAAPANTLGHPRSCTPAAKLLVPGTHSPALLPLLDNSLGSDLCTTTPASLFFPGVLLPPRAGVGYRVLVSQGPRLTSCSFFLTFLSLQVWKTSGRCWKGEWAGSFGFLLGFCWLYFLDLNCYLLSEIIMPKINSFLRF